MAAASALVITGFVVTNLITVLQPISSLWYIERNITTLSKDGVDYVLELSEPIGIVTLNFFPHRHEIKQVFPEIERKHARIYFALMPISFFSEYSMLPPLDFHSHGGQVRMLNPEPFVFYIGKDWQIYDYEFMLPKRRFWTVEKYVGERFCKHFSYSQVLYLG